MFIFYALQMKLTERAHLPMKVFRFSITYLMWLFAALLVDHYLPTTQAVLSAADSASPEIPACTEPLTLPARFNGQFGLVLYHQHHGVLLLRSGDRDDGGPKRIDLLFRGVVWMSLPAWFSDFTIEQCLLDEVLEYIPPSHRPKPSRARCFAWTSTARRTTSSPAACSRRPMTVRISIRRRCCPRSRSI